MEDNKNKDKKEQSRSDILGIIKSINLRIIGDSEGEEREERQSLFKEIMAKFLNLGGNLICKFLKAIDHRTKINIKIPSLIFLSKTKRDT